MDDLSGAHTRAGRCDAGELAEVEGRAPDRDSSERTAAAAYTNTARYAARPVAPLLAGVTLRGALGAPFFIAGTLKSVYDIGLYAFFRRVPLQGISEAAPARQSGTSSPLRSSRG